MHFKHTKPLIFSVVIAITLLFATLFVACGESTHTHDFGDWVTLVNVSCETDGVKERVCYTCGEHETEKIKAPGHSYGDFTVGAKPTCTGDGFKRRTCSVCAFTETQTIPAEGHAYGAPVTLVAATCVEDGSAERVCSACGDKVTQTLDALGHDITHHEKLPPTCTEIGHEAYDECSRCDYGTYKSIPATGHAFASAYSYDDNRHWRAATCGHAVEANGGAHEFGDGVCTVCAFKPNYTIGLKFTAIGTSSYGVSRGTASGDIVIPSEYNGLPVTTVNANGFKDDTNIKSVALGKNVTIIRENAFYGCTGLKSIDLDSVVKIEKRAFYNCAALEAVCFKDLTDIGEFAFEGSEILTRVVLPPSVTHIGRGAFYRCNNIKEMTLPFIGAVTDGEVKHFGHVFGALSAGVNADVVPSSLEKVVITGGTTLADRAFERCSGLKHIVLPDTLVSADKGAFNGAAIVTAVLPSLAVAALPQDSITEVTLTRGDIGAYAFKGCATLEKVIMTGDDTRVIGYSAFEGCAALKTVVFPENLSDVLDYAFRDCSALLSIDLPKSTIRVANYAFYNCAAAKSVTFGKDMTLIGSSAFMNCKNLVSVVIPEGMERVGSGAFEGCSALVSASLPESFTAIGTSVFKDCARLTSVNIPSAVTSIGGGAFEGCKAFKSFAVPDTVTSIGRGAFAGCTGLTDITLPFVGDRVRAATDYSQYPFGYVFYSKKSYDGCTPTEQKYHNWDFDALDGKTVYAIPDALKTVKITGGNILSGAFYNCGGLQKVILGSAVASIESNAFYGCIGLNAVEFETAVGWTVMPDGATSGVNVDVSKPEDNAVNLTETYLNFKWRR